MIIYYNIKQYRQKVKITQKQIAQVLNIPYQQYQRYETGEYPIPVQHLITLAQFYGVSTDYLLGLDTIENRKLKGVSLSAVHQSEPPCED